MARSDESTLQRLAVEAIRLGAESLEVEYKDGYEGVLAVKGQVGYGIARLRSSSPEGAALREELYSITGRKRRRVRVTVDEREYELRGRVYDSFGEDAFRVELRHV